MSMRQKERSQAQLADQIKINRSTVLLNKIKGDGMIYKLSIAFILGIVQMWIISDSEHYKKWFK